MKNGEGGSRNLKLTTAGKKELLYVRGRGITL